MNIFAIHHIALNYVPSGTQRQYADGPEADLKLRMLDARFGPMSGHYQLDRSCPESAKLGNGSRRKIALHCEPTRSEAVMSRHIVLVPMS